MNNLPKRLRELSDKLVSPFYEPQDIAFALNALADQLEKQPECPARHINVAPGSWCSKCGERMPL